MNNLWDKSRQKNDSMAAVGDVLESATPKLDLSMLHISQFTASIFDIKASNKDKSPGHGDHFGPGAGMASQLDREGVMSPCSALLMGGKSPLMDIHGVTRLPLEKREFG